MEEHHREPDLKSTPHHRHSDDIIIELLDIVQRMDTRLENHIQEEMVEMKKMVEDQTRKFEEFINKGFPKADPVFHKATHESLWQFIKAFFK